MIESLGVHLWGGGVTVEYAYAITNFSIFLIFTLGLNTSCSWTISYNIRFYLTSILTKFTLRGTSL